MVLLFIWRLWTGDKLFVSHCPHQTHTHITTQICSKIVVRDRMTAINTPIPERGRKGSTAELLLIILKSCWTNVAKSSILGCASLDLFPMTGYSSLFAISVGSTFGTFLFVTFVATSEEEIGKYAHWIEFFSTFSARTTWRSQVFIVFWIFSVLFTLGWWHSYWKTVLETFCVSYEFEPITF